MTQVGGSGEGGSGSERRLALVVEYDGSCYQGFQLQHQRPTIQGEIEQALKRFTQVDIRIRGASRTDSGAHAQGQVVDFTTAAEHPPDKFLRGLNFYLPSLAAVAGIENTPQLVIVLDVGVQLVNQKRGRVRTNGAKNGAGGDIGNI